MAVQLFSEFLQIIYELIDFIYQEFQNNSPLRVIPPRLQYNNFSSLARPYVTLDDIIFSIIQQEAIDKYTIYIQCRIEGIKKEIEKNQKMQLRHLAEIYTLYNGLADNLDQQMMATDEQLYVRQTQRQKAMIENIINDLDGV